MFKQKPNYSIASVSGCRTNRCKTNFYFMQVSWLRREVESYVREFKVELDYTHKNLRLLADHNLVA